MDKNRYKDIQRYKDIHKYTYTSKMNLDKYNKDIQSKKIC